MLITILGFITSPIGKIVSIAFGVLALAGSLLLALKIHDSAIRDEATLQFNNKQMSEVIATQNKTIKQLEDITKITTDTVNKANDQNTKIDDQAKDVENDLASKETIDSDKPSSDILKNVIRKLGKTQ
jgi:septal ring factor EnvC (AmiA/AmiB activator)